MDKKIKNAIKLLFDLVLLLPYEFAPERLGGSVWGAKLRS
jgi:hypothetical protein